MKTVGMAALGIAGMALAADAQVSIQYTRQSSHSKLTITYQGGFSYGYGYGGYGYGCGYGSAYGTSGGYYGWPGSYRSAVAPGVAAGMWHPWGAGYGVGYAGGGSTYYSGPVRPTLVAPERVVERSPENISAAALDLGRKRIRAGDYRGAVEDIRAAVVAEGENPTSEGWFAVTLALAGDVRNGDKALKAALAHGFRGKLDLVLRDEKEKGRVLAACSKLPGEAAAYVAALLGRPEALAGLAEKDPSLKPLVP